MSVFEYAMAILTLSCKQMERIERIQNEAMRIILGCTRDTACRAMRYLLDFPTIRDRLQICRARAYLRVNANTQHPLHSEIKKVKGSRLKRGRSWMGQAEDILQQVCSLEALEPGEEWVQVPTNFCTSFSVCIQLDRKCRQEIPAAVEVEVQALIFENSLEGDVVIYTDGSVVRRVKSSWAYTAQAGRRIVKEGSGGFAVTTSSLTMEVMAVSKAITWLESQTFTGACFLSDSMSMLRKIEMGWIRREWLLSLERSRVAKISFIFVPGHAGVQGNERADELAGTATVEGGPAMDQADILNALRDARLSQEPSDDCESTTMVRLREQQVKRGVAKQEHYAGSQRRLINQHRTGVVSRYTLRDLLRKGSEHLWTDWFDVQ